jgi:UDP-N-acetylmuramate--alanine ligase
MMITRTIFSGAARCPVADPAGSTGGAAAHEITAPPRPGARVHVAGVAGVGMSAVAQVLAARGCRVSGSDRFLDQGESLDTLDRLRATGVTMHPQDGSAVDAGLAALVVSTAIEADNPEMTAARGAGVPVVHRAEMLAAYANRARTVAVSGTSGKTTVTAMIGWILEQAGRDPTVVNGGVVRAWQAADRVGNVRAGAGDLWVVEADESDRSLLRFTPEIAVVTNISKDHFELDEVARLFAGFASQSKQVVGGPGVAELPGQAAAPEPFQPGRTAAGWVFPFGGVAVAVPMPGRHNAENAWTAMSAAAMLGIPPAAAAAALARFGGVHRRLECVGTAPRGIRVIDDYAHNPAKIEASWRAVAETAPRVLGFWRPHGFAPLRLMKDELAEALGRAVRPADRLYILPVFYAGGTARADFGAEAFADLVAALGVPVAAVADYESLRSRLAAEATPGCAILGMGARDPELPRFAARLAAGGLEESGAR